MQTYTPSSRRCAFQLLFLSRVFATKPFHQADSRVSRIFIIPIVLFHVVVAFLFKVMFFSYYVVTTSTPDPIPSPSDPANTPAALLF